jgi:hypothetical protein
MESTIKILLAAPTYSGKIYCQDQWLDQLEKLTYPVDVLIVDNSKYPNNYEYLKEKAENSKHNFKVEYCKPKPGTSVRDALNDCMTIIRKAILDGGYTHWFSLETDVFIPYNTIEYLLAFDKSFIGLPYFHGSGVNGTFLMQQDFPGLDKRLSNISLPKKSFLDFKGELITCYQGGIGCCLVKRAVIEYIPFRIADFAPEQFPDAFFHDDCLKAKIPYYICTGVIAEHINNGDRWKAVQKERPAYESKEVEIALMDLGLCDECQYLYIEQIGESKKYCCLVTDDLEIKDNSIRECKNFESR